MSGTRRSKPGRPLRQERFASSAALASGLRGNLVARRCMALRNPAHRALVWALAELSLRRPGELHPSATSFPAWPFGKPDETVGSAESAFDRIARELCELFPECVLGTAADAREEIPPFLERLCLDPDMDPAAVAVPHLRGIIPALVDYVGRFEEAARLSIARTSVTQSVFESLDFCRSQRGIVLLEGTYRSGKSISAQAWTLSHLGGARYVQLGAFTDATSFFRTIARALGTATSNGKKALELRAAVEAVLRSRDLMLVIDECEYLLPQTVRPYGAPDLLNWVMTCLTNAGVPVALIASRNFGRLLTSLERRLSIYGAEQFFGRLALRKQLPDSLREDDLFLIVKSILPSADEATRMLLVGHTLTAKGRVAALEHTANRARFFADRAGRRVQFEDVEKAIAEGIAPDPRSLRTPPVFPAGVRIDSAATVSPRENHPPRHTSPLAPPPPSSRDPLANPSPTSRDHLANPPQTPRETLADLSLSETD